MFQTISISELQRAGKKAFHSGEPVQYVLANNKKQGLIFSQEALEVMEQAGILEIIEDQLLAQKMNEVRDEDGFVEFEDLLK